MTGGPGLSPSHSEQSQTELWFADLAACGPALDAVEAGVPRLSNDDLHKIERSVTSGAAIHRRAAYIALRLIIERTFGAEWRRVPFAVAGTGKPYLDRIEGGFSLTHVDHYALIGISRTGPIGVDLEPIKPRAVANDRRHKIESAAVSLAHGASLPATTDTRFLQAWVRLEAVAKCDGRGIGRLLTGLGIIGGQNTYPTAAEAYVAETASAFSISDVDGLEASHGIVAAIAVPRGQAIADDMLMLPDTLESLASLVQIR